MSVWVPYKVWIFLTNGVTVSFAKDFFMEVANVGA